MENQEVIDLLSDSEGDEDVVGRSSGGSSAAAMAKVEDTHDKVVQNPYKKKQKITNTNNDTKQKGRKGQLKNDLPPSKRESHAELVFEQDVDHNRQHAKKSKSTKDDNNSDSDDDNDTQPSSAEEYAQHQLTTRIAHNLPPILYHDSCFVAGSTTCIDGSKAKTFTPPKCRCKPSKPCILKYSTRAGPNLDRPYYSCSKGTSGCNYFHFAFTSHMMHWYRFGSHNNHMLVNPRLGYRADDLVQGKVGDCWFLSALAVVAEREDLIGRLLGAPSKKSTDTFGVIEVRLFVDGFWQTVLIDDFLPCLIDQQSEKQEENMLQLAMQASLVEAGLDTSYNTKLNRESKKDKQRRVSSRFDKNCIADEAKITLHEITEYLHQDRFSKDPSYRSKTQSSLQPLDRQVTTSDLAYSKARNSQLWVPFLEKAYAKIHGSYKAISGGHVEEAFLDLTGAPTIVYNFDHHNFNARQFWGELILFRKKRLPMGCGTSTSQGGIVGGHAYSILDVKEIRNVGLDFFRDKLIQGTLGGVSGFTDVDGIVRLLRIRNPHGQGEWKGEFSDRSPIWERLLANKNVNGVSSNGMVDLTTDAPPEPQSPELKRTMKNDGTFWIDYDSFLMGFGNVDVVLAFEGNHAKSFSTNFTVKKSNHRCARAFELSAVPRQPGEEGSCSQVEVYVMIIQKTKRGASRGRTDRKVSYKACDTGILVGEQLSSTNSTGRLDLVDGRFFGVNRNGHIKLTLDRNKVNRRLVVMPISFGHPAATDEERSFVVRVVSDAPLFVQEVPTCPKMHLALERFCFGDKILSLTNSGTSSHRGVQGTKTMLMEQKIGNTHLFKVLRVDCLAGGGGTVLLYLIVNDECFLQSDNADISFSIEINCRGMICRTADGLEKHEVTSKGKKFEASWRRFGLTFTKESKSRLLAACVQSGQDFQMGSIKSKLKSTSDLGPMSKFVSKQSKPEASLKAKPSQKFSNYQEVGVFTSFDTPMDAFSSDFIDLSSTFNNTNQRFGGRQDEVIELYPNPSGTVHMNVDQDLNAAIIASMMENQSGAVQQNSTTENNSSFDDDISKAIAASLKDNETSIGAN